MSDLSFASFARLGLIVGVAIAAHLATVLIRLSNGRFLRSRLHSEAKARTITGFVTSLVVFGIYFAAVGFILSELGIALTTYLASASVIGLAVSFGSQGIVESVGMRFTVLINSSGTRVFVPNRAIASVINHLKG